jgi:hypothetical protein
MADRQPRSVTRMRHDLGDGGVAVEDGNHLAATHTPQVLAQLSPQPRHPDPDHGHDVTAAGFLRKVT